ncbi:MAG TPA: hypothetical protein VFM33_08265, partial [Aquabacterium sp.]|nr:hypothetical protein [Aquabacterium sp.]
MCWKTFRSLKKLHPAAYQMQSSRYMRTILWESRVILCNTITSVGCVFGVNLFSEDKTPRHHWDFNPIPTKKVSADLS